MVIRIHIGCNRLSISSPRPELPIDGSDLVNWECCPALCGFGFAFGSGRSGRPRRPVNGQAVPLR
jgi:hypothetical protein